MPESPPGSTIVVIGRDEMLSYLLKRYSEQDGGRMVVMESLPSAGELAGLQPAAIIFSSTDQMVEAQPVMDDPAMLDIPVLVCTSISDEARARELGADSCLLHPLTYDQFAAALAAVNPPAAG
jgi:DNA-binding response OmpR family regulator